MLCENRFEFIPKELSFMDSGEVVCVNMLLPGDPADHGFAAGSSLMFDGCMY